MPEDLDNKNNNAAPDVQSNMQDAEKKANETSASQPDYEGQGGESFDIVLEQIRSKMEDTYNQEAAQREDTTRQAKINEQYQRQKTKFEQANAHIQTLRNLNAERNMTVEDKREQARQQAKEEIEKVAKEQFEKDMTVRQKILVDIAGNQALNVLYEASEKLAEQAERGGSISYMIIICTYLIAFSKDLSDVLIDLAAPGWSFVITSIIGTICSAFLTFFWLSVAGNNWHGGMIMNQIVRYILGALIDSIPIFGIVPTYIILNIWSHINFIQSRRKAAEKLEEVNEQAEKVKTDIRSNGTNISAV